MKFEFPIEQEPKKNPNPIEQKIDRKVRKRIQIMIERKVKSVLQQLTNEFSSPTTSLCYSHLSIEQTLFDIEDER